VVQGSFVFSPSRLSPDPSRLEPFGGLGRLIDKPRLWSSLRGLVVLALGGAVITRTVMRSAADGARAHDPARLLHAASTVATSITIAIATIACLAAIADAIVGRRLWFGRLKMTREEVIREQKEGDGDPEIKRRREELHHELVASEAVAAVRDASVVVINPTHLACALRYDAAGGEEAAPTLVAKGHGALAERIVAAARQHGVPVVRDVPVARALVELEIGTEIPEALYEAVAEVLHAAWNGE
jgi:flagellar biosynthesis protein FlhB